MSFTYGNKIRVSIFGQSHSPAIGVTMDGLPAGFAVNFEELYKFMRRRAPGQHTHSTQRKEEDTPEFIAGLVNGMTCGAPLTAIIRNTDARSQDYENLRDVPRPSHADYTAYIKYGDSHDIRGGGAFSGRLTAPLCIAGGICIQLLEKEGIQIGAQIAEIGNIAGRPFDPLEIKTEDLHKLREAVFPTLETEAGERMLSAVAEARREGDSLGGVVECLAAGMPAGVGEPLFNGLENRLAQIIFGIPAVKGLEFGNGFAAARLRGSENNDVFYMDGEKVKTRTNNHGGILGGISSGMPILFRVAFKPTPSISKEQESVSLLRRENVRLAITGRHDPCIVPRAVPCVEAAAAVALYDALR